MTIIHYVNYFFPSAFFAENSAEKVPKRDIKIPKSQIPQKAFAYYFFDREEIISKDTGNILIGPPINRSPTYYPDGQIRTLDQLPQDQKILRSNVKYNSDGERAILTRIGNYQYYKKDSIIY